MAKEINSLDRLIEKHDTAETRAIRGKISLLIYSGYGITTYLADHGPHMTKFNELHNA